MPTLREIQDRFSAAVIHGDGPVIANTIVADAPSPVRRLAIYANHFRISLIEALESTYPVARQLVGDDFFRWMVRRYIASHPPRRPCLTEYGHSFPAFLDRQPYIAAVAYIGGVARLEWAINVARHAPEFADALGALETLARQPLPADALHLHPSCRLVASPYPIDAIWHAHQVPDPDFTGIDLRSGSVRLLVHRQGDDVGWFHLSLAEAVFIGSLIARGSLPKALAMANAVAGPFRSDPLLTVLFQRRLAMNLAASTANPPTQEYYQ
jgi:hypothetical protein